jgi:hypothetical protein
MIAVVMFRSYRHGIASTTRDRIENGDVQVPLEAGRDGSGTPGSLDLGSAVAPPSQEFATGRSPTTLSTVRTSMESMQACDFGVYSARSGEFEYRSRVSSSS